VRAGVTPRCVTLPLCYPGRGAYGRYPSSRRGILARVASLERPRCPCLPLFRDSENSLFPRARQPYIINQYAFARHSLDVLPLTPRPLRASMPLFYMLHAQGRPLSRAGGRYILVVVGPADLRLVAVPVCYFPAAAAVSASARSNRNLYLDVCEAVYCSTNTGSIQHNHFILSSAFWLNFALFTSIILEYVGLFFYST
jgi:hypothetical protein